MLLNCHTHYSFNYGTFSPERLLTTVKTNGYASFVLSDINNTSALISSLKEAKKIGIKLIAGIDFRNGIEQKYVGIAINNNGLNELHKHLSNHLHG